MRRFRMGTLLFAAVLLLIGSTALFAGAALAQEGSTPRPSHIHEGDCDEPGGVIQGLTPLTVPTGPTAGNSDAVLAEAAFSSIPLSLDEMLATDHSLKVHLSAERIEIYLVCGDIGGALDADGALIVGLKELDGSGYTGIAYLVPNANGQTSVSVMMAKVLPGGGPGDVPAAAPAAPAGATNAQQAAGPNQVDVALSEFVINMPAQIPAGPTQFNISNTGAAPHNLVIEGNGISQRLDANLAPGTTGQLTVDLAPGTYTVFCPVGEGAHRSNGMELTLTVT